MGERERRGKKVGGPGKGRRTYQNLRIRRISESEEGGERTRNCLTEVPVCVDNVCVCVYVRTHTCLVIVDISFVIISRSERSILATLKANKA